MSTEPSPLPASSTPTAVAGTDRPARPAPQSDAGPVVRSEHRADPSPARPDPTAVTDATMAGRREAARRRAAQGDDPEAESRPRRSGPTPPVGSQPGRRRAPSRRRRKVRKVHRVVRHIEVWSLAKLAAIFVACGYVVAMVAGYLLWRAADRVGTIDGIEGFMEDSGGYDTFEILGDVVFRASAGIGLVLAVVIVALVVLGAVLFNLISDLTGGIRMTVIDEDLVVTPARRPGPPPSDPASPGQSTPPGTEDRPPGS